MTETTAKRLACRGTPVNARYDQPPKQFSDCRSRLGVSDDRSSALPGIGRAHLASQREGKTFLQPALSLHLRTECHQGDLWKVQRKLTWLPFGYVQRAELDSMDLEVTIAFAAQDVVAVVVDLTSTEPRSGLALVCQGAVVAEDRRVSMTFKPDTGRLYIGQTSSPTSGIQLRREPSFRILTGFQFFFPWSATEGSEGQYRIESDLFRLDAGVTRRMLILLSAASYDCPESTPVDAEAEQRTAALVTRRLGNVERIPPEQILDSARNRWKEVEARLPFGETEDTWWPLLREAAVVLRKNTIEAQPEQGYGLCLGQRAGTFPARHAYEGFWIWDSAKHVWGLVDMDVELAMDNIRLFLDHQDRETGELCMLHPDSWIPSAQAPLFSNSALRIFNSLRLSGRVEQGRSFLSEVYRALALWNRWWFNQCDLNGDGLCEWRDNLESGLDDSPRWDTDRPAGFKNDFGAVQYSAVDLNAYLIADLRALASIAQELELANEAKDWSDKADQLAQQVVDVLYDRDDNLFYDVQVSTGEFSRIKTPACFLPLLAGVPLPPEAIREMLQRYLLDENHFWGKVPFPSVAYSERRHDARGTSGYWRGPTWLSQAYWMLSLLEGHRGLLDSGYAARIDGARKRLLDLVQKHGPYEYYNRDGPLPVEEGPPWLVRSHAHFSWTAASTIAIAACRYQIVPEVAPRPLPPCPLLHIGIELTDRHVYGRHKELVLLVSNRTDRAMEAWMSFDGPAGWRTEEIDTSCGGRAHAMTALYLAPHGRQRRLVRLTAPEALDWGEQVLQVRAVLQDGKEAGHQRLSLLRTSNPCAKWVPEWARGVSPTSAAFLLWDLPPFDFTFDGVWLGRSEPGLIGRHCDGLLWSRLRFRTHQSLAQHRARFDFGNHVQNHIAHLPDLSRLSEAIQSMKSACQFDCRSGGTLARREKCLLVLLEQASAALGKYHERPSSATSSG